MTRSHIRIWNSHPGVMMKTKIVVAAALVTFAALGSAGAADLPAPAYYKAPPPAPVYNWTGCYIAGGGGYGMWNQDSFVKSTATGTPITASQTNGGHGWFGLGQGGCDYEFTLPLFSGWSPRLVVSAFGDWDGVIGRLHDELRQVSRSGVAGQA